MLGKLMVFRLASTSSNIIPQTEPKVKSFSEICTNLSSQRKDSFENEHEAREGNAARADVGRRRN